MNEDKIITYRLKSISSWSKEKQDSFFWFVGNVGWRYSIQDDEIQCFERYWNIKALLKDTNKSIADLTKRAEENRSLRCKLKSEKELLANLERSLLNLIIEYRERTGFKPKVASIP